MMLSPREINAAVKQKLLKEGIKREPKRETYQVSPFNEIRKIPLKRLMERLAVTRFDTHPPFYGDDIQVKRIEGKVESVGDMVVISQ